MIQCFTHLHVSSAGQFEQILFFDATHNQHENPTSQYVSLKYKPSNILTTYLKGFFLQFNLI